MSSPASIACQPDWIWEAIAGVTRVVGIILHCLMEKVIVDEWLPTRNDEDGGFPLSDDATGQRFVVCLTPRPPKTFTSFEIVAAKYFCIVKRLVHDSCAGAKWKLDSMEHSWSTRVQQLQALLQAEDTVRNPSNLSTCAVDDMCEQIDVALLRHWMRPSLTSSQISSLTLKPTDFATTGHLGQGQFGVVSPQPFFMRD